MNLPPLPSSHNTYYTAEQMQEYAINAIKLNCIELNVDDHEIPPRMSLDSEYGTYVKFDALGGYIYEKLYAKKFLTLGSIYKVRSISIGHYSSEVQLQGIELMFNTCLFASVDKEFSETK